jgi:hypothetical protein
MTYTFPGLGKAEVMPASVSAEDHAVFLNWLRCYNNPNMNIMKDKNGRSIWFQVRGLPFYLVPFGSR